MFTCICLIKNAAPSVIDSGQPNNPAEGPNKCNLTNW